MVGREKSCLEENIREKRGRCLYNKKTRQHKFSEMNLNFHFPLPGDVKEKEVCISLPCIVYPTGISPDFLRDFRNFRCDLNRRKIF